MVFPSFDHVRIEPNGENVFAGRVAPGATVEMIRNREFYARAVADPSGLFALVAPPLPAGISHIHLESIAPDGQRASSKESVTVEISGDKSRRPLVELNSPDKPTVVLSNPDAPESRPQDSGNTVPSGGKPVASRPDIQIVSVEARDGGKLIVSGLAAPGASVRLYLNGAMVAPGGADSEGQLSFAIARGMGAGRYQVRLDDVDPVSGQVKSKAELYFEVPGAERGRTALQESDAARGRAGASLASRRQRVGHSFGTVTVGRGDSLWRISERHYGSGYFYSAITRANGAKIKNPDAIRPGQVLRLPPVD